MITISEIKELMHLHRINQKQLASALQIDKSTISAHLSGKLKLSRAYKAAYYYYFNFNINFPENYSQFLGFLEPIILDKRWFEKFGWKEISENIFDNISFNVAFEKKNDCFERYKGSKKIKYVHELQNYMYFAHDIKLSFNFLENKKIK
jgi:transcriptional regulator with XRE-family HTH domain